MGAQGREQTRGRFQGTTAVPSSAEFQDKRGCNDAFPSPTLVSTAVLVTAATAGANGGYCHEFAVCLMILQAPNVIDELSKQRLPGYQPSQSGRSGRVVVYTFCTREPRSKSLR